MTTQQTPKTAADDADADREASHRNAQLTTAEHESGAEQSAGTPVLGDPPYPDGQRAVGGRDDEAVPDPRYTASGPIDATRSGTVMEEWLDMQYPLETRGAETDGEIGGGTNYVGFQNEDGSGMLASKRGTAVYAVRTTDGQIILNESRRFSWPFGGPYEDTEEARADGLSVYEVPFRFIGQVGTERTDAHIVSDGDETGLVALGRTNEEDETEADMRNVDGRAFVRGCCDIDMLPEEHDEEGALFTHASGVQIYVGRDSTAFDTNSLFGYVPFDGEAGERVPTAEDALDLLKPRSVAASADPDAIQRQGEWFLTPLASTHVEHDPAGTIQKPGVNARPFGGSPLESHVPRDWRTGVSDAKFLARIYDAFPGLPSDGSIDTPQAVFDWLDEIDADDTYFEQARAHADGVYVQGTLRHRENEHYLENADEWAVTETHDHEVMTVEDRTLVYD